MSDDWPHELHADPATLDREFASVVTRFQHPLAAFLYQSVRDREQARDLTQEVFVKAHRALARYDSTRPFSTWLFAIAANHARDHLRRRQARIPTVSADHLDQPEPRSPEARPDEALAHRELGEQLDAALGQLPLEERELVVLRHVAGLGIDEIAQALGLAPANAKTKLFRARQRLQALLADQPE